MSFPELCQDISLLLTPLHACSGITRPESPGRRGAASRPADTAARQERERCPQAGPGSPQRERCPRLRFPGRSRAAQRAPSVAGSAAGGKRRRRRQHGRAERARAPLLLEPSLPPSLPARPGRRAPPPALPRQGPALLGRTSSGPAGARPSSGAAGSGPTRTCALGPRSAAPETASRRRAAQQPPRPARPSRARHFRGGEGKGPQRGPAPRRERARPGGPGAPGLLSALRPSCHRFCALRTKTDSLNLYSSGIFTFNKYCKHSLKHYRCTVGIYSTTNSRIAEVKILSNSIDFTIDLTSTLLNFLVYR